MSDTEPGVDGSQVEQSRAVWEDTLLMAQESVPQGFRHFLSPVIPPQPSPKEKIAEMRAQIQTVKGEAGVIKFVRVDEYEDPGFPHSSITLSFWPAHDPSLVSEDINVSTPYPGNDSGAAFVRTLRSNGRGGSFTQKDKEFTERRNRFLAKVKNLTKGK